MRGLQIGDLHILPEEQSFPAWVLPSITLEVFSSYLYLGSSLQGATLIGLW